MGKIQETFYDALVPDSCDRDTNRLRIYKAENGEITIHFRNLKIVLHTKEEIEEWKQGFAEAHANLGDWFNNDIA